MQNSGGMARAGRGLAVFVAIVVALYLGRVILVPVSLGLLLSLLLAPAVRRLERWGARPAFAAVVMVGLSFAVLGWCGWLLTQQASDLARKLPEYKDNLRSKTSSIGEPFGGLLGKAYATIHELGDEVASAGKSRAAPPTGDCF